MSNHEHYPTSLLLSSCPTCNRNASLIVLLAFIAASFTPISTPPSLASSPSSSASSTPPSTSRTSSRASTPFTAPFELEDLLNEPTPPPPLPFDDDPSPPPEPAFSPANPGVREELQYLDLVERVIRDGEPRPTVKGVGALALFAPPPIVISLSSPSSNPSNPPTLLLPLLTTKKTYPLTIAREFLWMLSSSTDAKLLQEKGVKLWDAHGSRDYLDYRGLVEHEEGDLGPIYGFQWRHFGAEYRTAKDPYEGEGVDQIKEVIKEIKEEPEKRRKLVVAWNPSDLAKMALPPCPVLMQFYVHSPDGPNEKPRLSAFVYQRSADLGLGLPFDLVTYSLLTHLIAHLTSTVPFKLRYSIGDAHVYLDHISPLQTQQLGKVPTGWTNLRWKRTREEIERAGGVDEVEVGDWEESLREYRGGEAIALKLHP